jgi:hypothetical protein
MPRFTTFLTRPLNALTALVVLVSAVAPALMQTSAAAVGQVTVRSVEMSTSAASTAGSYKLTFTPVTLTQEVVVEFCSDTPFPGATCAFATSSVPTVASPTSSAASAGANGTATALSGGTPTHAFKITGLTMAAGSSYNITVSGMTNPSTANATFYARIYTYTTGGAASYTEASSSGTAPTIGSPTDNGGVALATASTIAITAQVLETISFCVYLGTASCGTASFGLYISAAGSLTRAANYNGGSGTQYGLNTTNTLSTFGDQIASSAGAINASTSTITYGATASATTPAGIYTANHQLIATGTF